MRTSIYTKDQLIIDTPDQSATGTRRWSTATGPQPTKQKARTGRSVIVSLEIIVFGVMFVVTLGSAIGDAVRSATPFTSPCSWWSARSAWPWPSCSQGAFFVAAVQIIIYAGAIMVLFLFVIMLLGVDQQGVLERAPDGSATAGVWAGRVAGRQVLYVAVARSRPRVRRRAERTAHSRRSTAIPATCSAWPGCSSVDTCCRSRSPRCCSSWRSSA